MSAELIAEPVSAPSLRNANHLARPSRARRPLRRASSKPSRVPSRQRGSRCSRDRRAELLPRPQILIVRKPYQTAKRLFDLIACLAAMPFLLPVLAIIALAIWLTDPGPILFKQTRTGRGGRRFKMYKFRTMLKNAEELEKKYAHLNKLKWPDFKIENDPRVTFVGKFLRKTSLDELPQLFNVIKGDMSLVGPRPTIFATDKYELWQMERLEVLPGITGLWQISGRSDIEFDDRLRLDSEYIQKQSLWLDLCILWRTLPVVWQQHGAY
jgi:lipopolysaccharide/colanic/teichoic acid biosynthesis glycosyltransferase